MSPPAPPHRTSDVSLPNETLVAIFNDLPPTVLTDLTRVSRRFNAVAERILYSSISITDLLSQSSNPTKTLRCCESILGRPHLVESIRRLQIRWQGDFRVLSPQQLVDACTVAGVALRSLTFLESLDIFLGPANLAIVPLFQPMHAVERMVRGCQFPYLRYCAFGAEWTKGVQPYTDILPTFLTLVPSLERLKLSDHHATLILTPDALPCLAYFRGSPDAAAVLLPGRPVQYLALLGQDSDVTRENLPKMAHTSVPLRSLDLSAMQVRPTLLRNISTHLSTIHTLKVRLALRHTLHYALSGISLLAGLSSVLSEFPQLCCFDLSPTEIDRTKQAKFSEEYSLCTEWSRACPTLQKIIFPSGTEWQLTKDGIWA